MPKATREEAQEARHRLDQLEREAKAGAPDPWLSKEARCSVALVRTWRREKGITRSRGPARREEMDSFALGLLGRPVPDVLMRTTSSPIKGRWEPPEFVLRGEVDYEGLVNLMHYLHRQGGFPLKKIADSLGFTHRTVQQAIALGDRAQGEDDD